ncbi:(d)CMP kinase [Tenacibaculum maritimum]|uniref:Cytidylate kinase n=1 Tax=Tenacibaculum maritimum NCIMB 2154 TaxID=1349785 RepID=A0A2H1E9L4_9FLAO|nr:(d)CMP kinase [Tenacibaculum maritimum]MCD9563641.1 (d)CMP kinase [Tenacibaculum maritimum]MCD9564534.1 (d)CMP kinase [Tenacibaculum maritimum]MCD9578115.1 (d)CMP kinase [Tenacibaculum maritimum]MCD9582687.1 (d)CMP kinase [Tenacibaculum maritimum]MCD9584828.1 (d)CMP kinase [Tenacibaculum maritimum]
MSKKITIAIDGFSSTGKSTIAKQLAKKLGYIYVDTGAMYRAVTLYAMNQNFISDDTFDSNGLINNLNHIKLSFLFNENLGYAEMYLNGKNVEKQIRTIEVSKLVSLVSTISEVRKKLVDAQQEMGKNKGIVMDGRDIGTVVFPNAELKLYMTASADKRAKRRYKELIDRGDKVNYDEILHNVQERDRIDSTRKDSPLLKASDAIEFDNSDMGLEEQFERIMSLVNNRIQF